MRIYFSGIGGVGIGPLAEFAHQAGHEVVGSDLAFSPMVDQLAAMGIEVHIGQDGSQIALAHQAEPIDLFIYTAALPVDHPELSFCQSHDIPAYKRDELVNRLIREHQLRLIAVAGTHGKTNTTGMLIWVLQQLNMPVSYTIGTTISFGPSGLFAGDNSLFVYECDEFDRNFLHFEPELSLIMSMDYDHPDVYPNVEDYQAAFGQFAEQSGRVLMWDEQYRQLPADTSADITAFVDEQQPEFHLPGAHTRRNAFLVLQAIKVLLPEATEKDIIAAINTFPGTNRRFEKLTDNLYSDYGHHPAEIAVNIAAARELNPHVVLVYQPHQNIRQHAIRQEYRDALVGAEHIYWLPTYLSRENDLPVLSPSELIADLDNATDAEPAEMNDKLWEAIQKARTDGSLVLVMSAGSLDAWVRQRLSSTPSEL